MAKPSNTAAITSKPLGAGESKTVSTRRIDNGVIVSESSYNPKTGSYKSNERFEPQGGGSPGCETLRDAMDYLGEK